MSAMTQRKGMRIKGIYAHLDCLLAGIERLKSEGVTATRS